MQLLAVCRLVTLVQTGAGCSVPVSVREGAAIGAIEGNVPVFIVVFTAANTGILQLEGLVIVPKGKENRNKYFETFASIKALSIFLMTFLKGLLALT